MTKMKWKGLILWKRRRGSVCEVTSRVQRREILTQKTQLHSESAPARPSISNRNIYHIETHKHLQHTNLWNSHFFLSYSLKSKLS